MGNPIPIREIIIKLKKVRDEKKLSYGDILDLMEKNGEFVSKSTLSRIFSEGSEEIDFSYEGTIRPIANALLDIETIDDDDDLDIQAMKSLLIYKMKYIEELESELNEEKAARDRDKVKYHEKMDKQRAQLQNSIDFLKNQILLKDKRIDQLMASAAQFTDHIMNCPYRGK